MSTLTQIREQLDKEAAAKAKAEAAAVKKPTKTTKSK